jgi:hypothetical protein
MKAAGFDALTGLKSGGGAGAEDESTGDVRRIVREEIAKQLNTDPGGHLACLIQDVVEACPATGDHTDDAPPAPGNTEKNSGGGHPAVDYLTGL